MTKLLEVKGLETRFFTQDGVVHAVNGISYSLDEGETLAIVGESGCGKSVGVMSLMRLIPQPPGKITGGEVLFGTGDDRKDLLKITDDEIRQVRGNQIAMIFQDPMTSLNPVLTVGFRFPKHSFAHGDGQSGGRANAASNCLSWSAFPARPIGSTIIRTNSPAACASA